MKRLVVYSSQGGNTRKLAEAAFARLPEDKDIFPVAQAPDPKEYDVAVIAFWYKGGQPDPDSQEYLKKCGGAKKLFLIGCHGAAPNSDQARMGMNMARDLAAGANIVGSFDCQGEVPGQVIENAGNQNPQPAWLRDAQTAKGHPGDNDIYNLCMALEKHGLAECPKPGEKRMFS